MNPLEAGERETAVNNKNVKCLRLKESIDSLRTIAPLTMN